MYMPPNPFTQPYQVKPEDKDFLTLAANLQVNYQDLRSANPYIQSLSQGQMVNVPGTTPSPNAGLVANVMQHQTAIQQANAPTPKIAGVSTSISGIPKPPSQAYNAYGPNRGPNGASLAAPASAYAGYQDFAQRQGVKNLSPDAALNQWATTQTLPPDLDPSVADYLISQGADPALIQQAMQKGAQEAAKITVTDPLAGTPGHYYVDETTAPHVGTIITRKDGTRRWLLKDKNGRLYYSKVGQNRRGRAARQAARVQQVVPSITSPDAPMTALNVILGS